MEGLAAGRQAQTRTLVTPNTTGSHGIRHEYHRGFNGAAPRARRYATGNGRVASAIPLAGPRLCHYDTRMQNNSLSDPAGAPSMADLAHDIRHAFATGRRARAGAAPSDAAAAYAVQASVAAARGAVAGFKTARKPDQPQIMAPIMAADLVANGARVSSRFGGAMGVELELGLRIAAPLPDPADPGFRAALAACIEPLAVIELVDTRLEGPAADDPLAKLADGQINAGLVVGPALTGWDGGPLTGAAARMQAGDDVLLDGPADVPGGDARDTLRALAAMIGGHCGGLRPGQIVITGALHPLTYAAPGTAVAGWIDGCGEVSVTIG